MGREILDLAGSLVKPGVTTDEIDEIVHNAIIERNAYPSPMNYRDYPKSICTYVICTSTFQRSEKTVIRRSINEVICHGIPDKRKLREVFEDNDIQCVVNLAKLRGRDTLDEDYVARRNAVDFGLPLIVRRCNFAHRAGVCL